MTKTELKKIHTKINALSDFQRVEFDRVLARDNRVLDELTHDSDSFFEDTVRLAIGDARALVEPAELSKSEIKEQFRDQGFGLILALEEAGLAFVKTQETDKGVHTMRAYIRISDCAAIIKQNKVASAKKKAKALLSVLHDLRNSTDSQASNYMTIVATGNTRTFGFAVPCPAALARHYKEVEQAEELAVALPATEEAVAA